MDKDSTHEGGQKSLLDHKPQEPKQAPKPEPTVVNEEQDAPKSNAIAQASGHVARITTSEVARSMILKYATEMLGNERAKEYFMQLGFMMRTTPKLMECSPESIFVSMMQCVNIDLMPNTPEQYCAIIPRNNRQLGTVEAHFELMYQGAKELAYRTGQVKTIKAELVFPDDDFDYDDAMNTIHHKKALNIDRTNTDNMIAAYAIAKLSNGEVQFVVVAPSDLKKVMNSSQSVYEGKAKSGSAWANWAERQHLKTAIKRLAKDLPSSRKDDRLKFAVNWDGANEGGKRLAVDMETGRIIDGEAMLSHEIQDKLEKAKTAQELQKVINGLSAEDRKLAQPLIDRRIEEIM
jgi:phage RecT family recombinase